MENILIHTKKLCKTYAIGSEQYHAIRNIDLDIYEGDFTVIMGSSGSGKSTLLYLLSGLDQATVGEVYFKERRIDKLKEQEIADFRSKNIGYVYQDINLIPDMTLFENITFPGCIAGYKKKDIENNAWNLLKSMGLKEQAGKMPAQVSGGQQQRAAIARAMINMPEVLFADEPTGNLNHEMGMAILDIFTQMNRNGQSIVMVTHDIKAACRANRIIIIKDGKVGEIIKLGKYVHQEIKRRENMIYSYLSKEEV